MRPCVCLCTFAYVCVIVCVREPAVACNFVIVCESVWVYVCAYVCMCPSV